MEYIEKDYKHYKAARTASIFAFASLASTILCTLILPFIFSSLSIIFAFLSKGKTKCYSMMAKISILVASLSLVLNIFIGTFAVYNVFFNDSYKEQVDQIFTEYYGMTFDEYKEALYKELTAPQ